MASQRRRSSTLQNPIPNPVQQTAGNSIVSDLTTPSPPVAASEEGDLSNVVDSVDYDDLVGDELDKDENGGDGGDSDDEGDEFFVHNEEDSDEEESEEVELQRREDCAGSSKCFVDLTDSTGGVVGNVLFEEGDVCRTELDSSVPKDVKIYKPPADWTIPRPRHDRNEPYFEDVDNPGNWPQYCFRPKFVKGPGAGSKVEYSHHCLPTGAIPFPKNEDGMRVCDGWEFHYNGWKNPDGSNQHRRGATTSNMFPDDTKGCLDADILTKLGLNEKRMGKTDDQETDALFFHQLILPICDPKKSGIANDPRTAYYSEVENFTNGSKAWSGSGGSYGHAWKNVNLKELTIFDGILVRDGVLGGSQGAIHRRWEVDGPCYDPLIANAMTLARFGQIKRSLKLCNNYAAPKRGQGK